MTDTSIRILTAHHDRVVPATGEYLIDAAHTSVEFVARHLMITKVRGRVPSVTGTITIAEDPERSHAEATLEATTLDTGNPDRDRHLRSADFFDVDRHPHLTYRSTGVRQGPSGDWIVAGDLTIRDVTRAVELPVVFEGTSTAPDGTERIGFSAAAEVNREDWGLTWNRSLEAGGVLVASKVRIELEIQAVRQR